MHLYFTDQEIPSFYEYVNGKFLQTLHTPAVDICILDCVLSSNRFLKEFSKSTSDSIHLWPVCTHLFIITVNIRDNRN
ncbi:hypothetical protein PHYPO_G00060970 [Pangasianodon hypophthalmus]|uniref:Uncharacterized protein n=1 Tax=Pangasianodon hypophthalmus TaxID=310915 RepID=A0A5N5M1E3_PANHP|nr:hypothetical protein PHYPO_G00060970 [Pangasianodon hypophthalmus]